MEETVTYAVHKSAKPALDAASRCPGVIYENLSEDKYMPGHGWAGFCSEGVTGTIHHDGNHHWIVAISKPNEGQVRTTYKRAFGTYTHAFAALQEQLAQAGAPKGSSSLLH
jgi:hypothetical protein